MTNEPPKLTDFLAPPREKGRRSRTMVSLKPQDFDRVDVLAIKFEVTKGALIASLLDFYEAHQL